MTLRPTRTYTIRHFMRLLLDVPSLRHAPKKWHPLWRLIRTPRYQPGVTELCQSVELKFVDAASFLSAYIAIFEQKSFEFRTASNAPTFIDCGANIGLATIYLKQLYPNSTIVAFEPDPAIYQVLNANIRHLGLPNIQLHQEAVWDCEAELDFFAEGSDAGHILFGDQHAPSAIRVRTVPLWDYLDQHIDFLKIDIEGAETQVLTSCRDRLSNVDRLFIEYHSYRDQPQTLHTIIDLLASAGYRNQIHTGQTNLHPFLPPKTNLDTDMLLNIFAFRP